MSFFKCKMCGGTLEISNETVAVCEYCGTKQSLPKLGDDRKANLYDRANHFRRNNEFDKAMGIYEQILNDDNTDAETYWSLVLCRYGIEYVEDPTSHRRVPTVNRAQYTSIFDDEDYKAAIQYADGYQREIYEQEAAAINEIQKSILAISGQEDPFDVFICYKETDRNGRRTPDSVLATELYHELTREGYKVFFSRITLEDKLGTAYEPYIFAALNSAKVMVVLGTKPEHFNAVWVKNEWSRYLALIKNGARKMLIPAYKDMDPYDLPEEFSHLQAQDMSKLGFMQDLIRGIKKIVDSQTEKQTIHETIIANDALGGNVTALLKRGFLSLEDGEWAKADDFFEQTLNQNAELAEAYLGMLMAELQVKNQESLKDCAEPFDNRKNYQKAVRFANAKLRTFLVDTIRFINDRNENTRLSNAYAQATQIMTAATEEAYLSAAKLFEAISGYKDADALANECRTLADAVRKETIYVKACALSNEDVYRSRGKRPAIQDYEEAITLFKSINGWKDSDAKIALCYQKIEGLKIQQEQDRVRKEAEAARREAERTAMFKNSMVVGAILAAVVVLVLLFTQWLLPDVIQPSIAYGEAEKLLSAGQYDDAIRAFRELGEYKNSSEMVKESHYQKACWLMGQGEYETASRIFSELSEYKDSSTQKAAIDEIWNSEAYASAEELLANGQYEAALKAFAALGNYKDSADRVNDAQEAIYARDYAAAEILFENKDYENAKAAFAALGNYKDSAQKVTECENNIQQQINAELARQYENAKQLMSQGQAGKAAMAFYNLGNYMDAREQAKKLWNSIADRDTIAASRHVVGLKEDGTVVAAGDNDEGQCNVGDWENIIAISTYIGAEHTVGLKEDGTVVAVGDNSYGQCDVGSWIDIVAISVGRSHTVGLKADGTVVVAGDNKSGQCNVSSWRDIIAISAGYDNTIGLKADGTVVIAGDNEYGKIDVSGWKNIVAIRSGSSCVIGLGADGTVIVTGDNGLDQCNVSGWWNMIDISSGDGTTVGLRANGRVVAVGWDIDDQCNVSSWRDIVAISGGQRFTVGLKADGTVVVNGDNDWGQNDASNWTNIKVP